MKDISFFKNDIAVRDTLMAHTTNQERRKLLYKWVSNKLITYEQFDSLIYYVK